ncbi:hypothetical protein HAX54_000099, partial [Datura stramonium]|nr:hypothetical protein [Datura stramonium]
GRDRDLVEIKIDCRSRGKEWGRGREFGLGVGVGDGGEITESGTGSRVLGRVRIECRGRNENGGQDRILRLGSRSESWSGVGVGLGGLNFGLEVGSRGGKRGPVIEDGVDVKSQKSDLVRCRGWDGNIKSRSWVVLLTTFKPLFEISKPPQWGEKQH